MKNCVLTKLNKETKKYLNKCRDPQAHGLEDLQSEYVHSPQIQVQV